MTLFDTDVLIWYLRGDINAARSIDKATKRAVSLVNYMELLQGSRSRDEAHSIKGFLKDFGFMTLPITENIGHRSSVYIEEYSLSHGIGIADALVAATAVEENATLCSANVKHFKCVRDLQLQQFRPSR